MSKLIIPFLIFGLFCISGCGNQDKDLVFICKQELDAAYLRLGKPAGRDKATLEKIRKESQPQITKLTFAGKEGLSIATSVVDDHILILIGTNFDMRTQAEWRPPN